MRCGEQPAADDVREWVFLATVSPWLVIPPVSRWVVLRLEDLTQAVTGERP